MSAFKDRITKYNAQKETKVNPPEAAKVLEEKAAPEVENVKPVPISETPGLFGDAPAPAAESSATASVEAPKAKRGRPAGSKNSAKQPEPEPEPTTEATSAPAPRVVVTGEVCTDVNELVRALNDYGYVVTLTR